MKVHTVLVLLGLLHGVLSETMPVVGNLHGDGSDLTSKIEYIEKEIERVRGSIEVLHGRVHLVEARLNGRCLGDTQQTAVYSCEDILHRRVCSDQSGYYWLVGGSGYPVKVYCEMNGEECCRREGVFMRVAHLDMTKPDHQCPVDWEEITVPRRACKRPDYSKGCSIMVFDTYNIPYRRVCGRVLGYQYGAVDGFARGEKEGLGIDEAYLDGVSITYGKQAKHIWSFVGASHFNTSSCQCKEESTNTPSFVGDDYFCDGSTHLDSGDPKPELYVANRLWQGKCKESDHECCSFNSPPIFCKELPEPTAENIELRLCGGDQTLGDTPLELIELYVQF